MCTVTFIPSGEKFFITSNRDENPGRKAKGLISAHTPGKNMIHYPLDEESGGSWIALSDDGRAVCLLNGAFEPFIPRPVYRLSRGIVVIDALNEPDFENFLHQYPLHDIAPFTLLFFEKEKFLQLVWDGDNKHITSLDLHKPGIWSSVTLYPPPIREWRKSLFDNWLLPRETFDRESIIDFHRMANGDPNNDFVMNRNDIVKTLSVTSIELRTHSASIVHMDLHDNLREEIMVTYA